MWTTVALTASLLDDVKKSSLFRLFPAFAMEPGCFRELVSGREFGRK